MALPRDHYTDRAKRTLSIAHDCAQQANLDEVSPSLILLGLAKGDRGVAHIVLESLSVDLSTLQHEIPVPTAQPPRNAYPMYLPLNAAATHLIAFGKEEGAKLSLGRYFGTEHLLLGIMCLKDDPAVLFLHGLSVTLDAVRNGIRSVLRLDRNNNS